MADLIGEDWLGSSLDMTGRSWVDMAGIVELLKGMHFSRELDCGNWPWRWLERLVDWASFPSSWLKAEIC